MFYGIRWFALPLTFSGLAKVAIFTTNVDAENQTLINHKCFCGALNRHFCQTRVCALNVKYSSLK
jgi:NADPH-dependent 7-cyano-7-deazaguanine reductase QueF-like protein